MKGLVVHEMGKFFECYPTEIFVMASLPYFFVFTVLTFNKPSEELC